MSLDEHKDSLIGNWIGDNMLRLSWLSPSEFYSTSKLTVARTVRDKFLTFNYDWTHEDKQHEGLLLVGYDAKEKLISASWVDSWHSSAKPLALSGNIEENGAINLYGTYEIPNHPDWGWRIIITATQDNLQITMFNIPPEGEEDLAVKADYRKAVE